MRFICNAHTASFKKAKNNISIALIATLDTEALGGVRGGDLGGQRGIVPSNM